MDSEHATNGDATANGNGVNGEHANSRARSESFSQMSEDSQTAADFLREQEQLEADALEALPYSIENCTKPLGALRQSVYACLTCNPPPAEPSDPYTKPAGICYACSVQCHGEHKLVEIFNKRNFTCDCGTTRLPDATPCNLRIKQDTNTKGDVRSEAPDPNNKYNQNFRNRFCGCECDYDPQKQKGTMFQCLGLGTHETGGCGEDWWHPGCVVGLGPDWSDNLHSAKSDAVKELETAEGSLPTISEDAEAPTTAAPEQPARDGHDDAEDPPPPPGFPKEDDFDGFLCYRCVEAYPWIRRYAGASGFLPPVYLRKDGAVEPLPGLALEEPQDSKKRKAEDDSAMTDVGGLKRQRSETGGPITPTSANETAAATNSCKLGRLPPAPSGRFSLFLKEDFREQFCRCSSCFPLLQSHPQLLEEEETYEPPVSDGAPSEGGSTHGGSGGSLYDRGESALRTLDRVQAIEGVMAYNHMKDKLKTFFQPFAESGKAVSAEDVKAYFAKLRGDDQAIREAREGAESTEDSRREQSGY